MNYSFRNLHVYVSQTIAPASLYFQELKKADFEQWKTFFSDECRELRLLMTEYLLGTDTEEVKMIWMHSLQQQIVVLSDQINHHLFRERKLWAGHTASEQIRVHYINSLSTLEGFLEYSALHFPAYYDYRIKLTDFRLRNTLPGLRSKLTELKILFVQANISPCLSATVIKGLNGLLHPRKLTDAGAKYLLNLVQETKKLEVLDDSRLQELLLRLDFNQPEFLSAKIDETEAALAEIHGLHDQVEALLHQMDSLEKGKRQHDFSLHPTQFSLHFELITYLKQRSKHLEELMAVRRIALQDKAEMENIFRIKTDLPVEQMALFIRMLQVKGVVVRKEVGEVFNFFARYFYTDKALFISARNMLKKSTEVNFSTVLKIWELLESWMDWLDELFSVRNYRRSLR